jgi:lipopolysaccharide export system permease protein
VIPPANVKRIEYTNKWVKNKRVDYGSNIQLQIKPGVIMYMSHYDNTTKQGFKFSLDKFDDKLLKSRLTAQSVKYDTLYRWGTINDYSIRDFHGMRETITKGTSKDTVFWALILRTSLLPTMIRKCLLCLN